MIKVREHKIELMAMTAKMAMLTSKFQETRKNAESHMSTGEFWQSFCDFVILQQKGDIDELQKKQKEKPDEICPKEKQISKVQEVQESRGQYAI